MALKHNKISIEVFGPPTSPETARDDPSHADEAILILARLIGRQIGREQFQKKMALERRSNNARKRNKES